MLPNFDGYVREGPLSLLLIPVLQKTIPKYPALACGLINEDSRNPAFIRLKGIDLLSGIQEIEVSNRQSTEQVLEDALSVEHSKLWPDPSTNPLWKLMVFRHSAHEDPSDRVVIDISLVFHHGLMDGVSAYAFHQSLLETFNSPSEPRDISHIYLAPDSVELAPPVEDYFNLKATNGRLISELFTGFVPRWIRSQVCSTKLPWAGASSNLPEKSAFVSQLRVINIEALHIPRIRAKCRQSSTTFTALLHGIIVSCLAYQVPRAESFVATTPFSVRNLSKIASSELVNQYSVVDTTYLRRDFGLAAEEPEEVDISNAARLGNQFLCDMRESLAVFPVDNMLSLLEYITDFQAFFRSKLGKPRASSFEVSNLGVFDDHSGGNQDENKTCRIIRLLFSQSGSVVGNAISFNVANVKNGPLTVSLTWQDGAVETSQAEQLLGRIKRTLENLP